MRSVLRLLLATAMLATATPAAAIFGDDEARRRIDALSKEVAARAREVDERLSRIEANAAERRVIIDLATQIEALRADMAKLRGQIEVLTNRIDTADKRQQDLYLDIDTRLRKLEQVREQALAAPPGTGDPATAGVEPQASPAETKAYEAALNQFKLGSYALAISAFQGFLVTYPSSPLAPSAQYWVGNAHFAQREYRGAIAAQQKLLSAWPQSSKAPDAMLNIASSREALGDKRGAQRVLQELIEKFPESPAAASAKQRLAQKP